MGRDLLDRQFFARQQPDDLEPVTIRQGFEEVQQGLVLLRGVQIS